MIPPLAPPLVPSLAPVLALMTAAGVAAALAAHRWDRRGLYAAGKALASAAFVGIALTGGWPDTGWGQGMVVALVASAIGDVVLAGRGRAAFAVGLCAFFAAHASYAASFVILAGRPLVSLVVAALAAVAAVPAWRALASRWTVPSDLRRPVAVYLALVLTMIGLAGVAAAVTGGVAEGVSGGVTAAPDGRIGLALGAVLVGGSDVAVGRDAFGRRAFTNKLVGLLTYYAGQVLLALQVAAG